jgi:fructokinase
MPSAEPPVRVVVFGEALVDLVPGDDARYTAVVGGGPANTAVALARAGIPTSLVTGVPQDALGDRILDHLRASGVETSSIVVSNRPCTLAVVESPHDPEYAIYTVGTAAFDLSAAPRVVGPEVEALHVASLALFVEPSASVAVELVERERRRRLVSVDPNIRPVAIGDRARARSRFERLCASADLVRMSVTDASYLYPNESRAAVTEYLLAVGPDLVLLTDGASGAHAATMTARAHVPSRPVAVVDTIGAGDTFNAAALAFCLRRGWRAGADLARVTQDELEQLLVACVDAAAITCSRAGADPPWLPETS